MGRSSVDVEGSSRHHAPCGRWSSGDLDSIVRSIFAVIVAGVDRCNFPCPLDSGMALVEARYATRINDAVAVSVMTFVELRSG